MEGFTWGSAFAGAIGGFATLLGALLTEHFKGKWERGQTGLDEQLKECRTALAEFVTFYDDPQTAAYGADEHEWASIHEAVENAFGARFASSCVDALHATFAEGGLEWRAACADRMRDRIREIEEELGIPARVALEPVQPIAPR